MNIGFGTYRLRIGPGQRSGAPCTDRLMDADRTDRDLALLAQAEREYRDTVWRQSSILAGERRLL